MEIPKCQIENPPFVFLITNMIIRNPGKKNVLEIMICKHLVIKLFNQGSFYQYCSERSLSLISQAKPPRQEMTC